MIVAVVRFPLPAPMSRDDAADWFESGAAAYQSVPGLQRKHFLLGEGGTTAGGVYLWETRSAAEAFYNEAWRARVAGKYGEPTVEYFDTPVMVDPTTITRT
jgi:Putative mono-oxygenase ydhR